MNEIEAALYYENRRKELFKGFTQHQTQIKNSKNKANVIEKTPNLKEFIVYSQFPQTKTLRKSCSTPYNYNLKQQFSKGAIDKKPIQLTENPSQASTASSSKNLKEKKSFIKKESFYQKKPQNNNSNEKQADLKASSKINYSNQKNKEKSKNFTPLPSAEKFKKPLISYSDRKIGTVNRDLKSSAIKKKSLIVEKKTKVLTIDLKELRKKISETNFKPQYFSLKNFDKNVGKIVKNGRNSRECSLILEEGVKRIEEDFNRSRSFSFNSYGGNQT